MSFNEYYEAELSKNKTEDEKKADIKKIMEDLGLIKQSFLSKKVEKGNNPEERKNKRNEFLIK